MNDTDVRTAEGGSQDGDLLPARPAALGLAGRIRAHPLSQPLADAVLLGPATALQVSGVHDRVVAALLIVFWCSHVHRLATTSREILPNILLLGLSGWTVLLYEARPRGAGSAPELWGLLVHLAVLRGAADWRWDKGWSWLLGIVLAGSGALLAVLALFGTEWKADFANNSTAWRSGERSLLPRTITNRVLGLPHIVHTVSTSHDIRPGFPSNEVAGVLALFLFLPAAWLLFRRLHWGALWIIPVGGLLIFVQLMAGSRSALLGAGAGIAFLAVLRWPWLRPAVAVALAGAIVAIIAVVVLAGPRSSVLRATGDFAGRSDLWSHGIGYLRRSPLTGSGLNRFPDLYLDDHPGYANGDASYLPPHAHNLFLQTALDLGLPGLLAVVALLLLAVRGLVTGWRAVPEPERWLLAAISAGCAGFLVFNLTDAVAPGARAGFPFWLLLGLLIGGGLQHKPATESQRTASRT